MVLVLPVAIVAGVVVVAGIGWAGSRLGRRIGRRWLVAVVAAACLCAAVVVLAVGTGFALPAPVAIVVLAVLVVTGLVCLAAAFGADAAVTPVQEWASAHGVAITERNAGFVTDYVREGHRLRLVCGFGGLLAAFALASGTGIHLRVTGWVWLLVGYLVGVVWSEAWLTRLPTGTQRAASLSPRRVRDYLARHLLVLQVLALCATTALAALALAAGADVRITTDAALTVGGTSAAALRRAAIGFGVAGLVLVGGVGVLAHHIVHKAQPLTEPDLLAADDAVRASSVHLLSATVVALLLILLGTQLRMLATLGLVPTSAAALPYLACLLVAFGVWRFSGHRAWIVPRWRTRPRRRARLRRPAGGVVS